MADRPRSHEDFDGWQLPSRETQTIERSHARSRKNASGLFRLLQDLLGRDKAGNIKPKNEWIHAINWDLVIFDEYHFGAWRDTAKELFEGEEEAYRQEGSQARDTPRDSKSVNEDLGEPRRRRAIPADHDRAYLYLSGTPFRAVETGEFIEEQIFNWTYTDEQRAKAEFAAKHPDKWNPYAALPQMRTADLPDAGRAAGDRQRRRVRRVRPERVLRGLRHGAKAAVQAQERRAEVAGHHPRPVRA